MVPEITRLESQSIFFGLLPKGWHEKRELVAEAQVVQDHLTAEVQCALCKESAVLQQSLRIYGIHDDNGVDVEIDSPLYAGAKKALETLFSGPRCDECETNTFDNIEIEKILRCD